MKPKLDSMLAAALVLLASSALAQESIGVVKRTKGDVVIARSGAELPSKAGMEIRKGDRLITGANGYVVITMPRAVPLTVGPHTNVVLDRFSPDEKRAIQTSIPRLLQGITSWLTVNRQR